MRTVKHEASFLFFLFVRAFSSREKRSCTFPRLRAGIRYLSAQLKVSEAEIEHVAPL
jgi:hypothetical protein